MNIQRYIDQPFDFITSLCICALFLISPSLMASTALDITNFPSSASYIRHAHISGFTTQPFVIFENPASLARLQYPSFSVFNSSIVDNESHLYSLALHYPLKKGHLAFGYMEHGVSDIPKTADTLEQYFLNNNYFKFPVVESYFSYRDSAFKLGYAYPLTSDLNIGTNLTYFNYEMDTVSGEAYNMDVGFFSSLNPQLYFSAVFKNVLAFSKMKYSHQKTLHLPQKMDLAFKYHFERLSLLGQISLLYNQNTFAHIKLESSPSIAFEIPIYDYPNINLSGGYSIQVEQAEYFGLYSIGLNFDTRFFGCDFAYEQSDYQANKNNYFFSVHLKNALFKSASKKEQIKMSSVSSASSYTPPKKAVAVNPVVKPAVKTFVKPVAQAISKPVVLAIEKPVTQDIEKPVAQAIEKPVTQDIEKPIAQDIEKPVVQANIKTPPKALPAPKNIDQSLTINESIETLLPPLNLNQSTTQVVSDIPSDIEPETKKISPLLKVVGATVSLFIFFVLARFILFKP